MREWVSEVAEMADEGVILLDGYDEAIVGTTYTDGLHVVYSQKRIYEILANGAEMDAEDIVEWFDFNIESLRHMEGGPIFLVTPDLDEALAP